MHLFILLMFCLNLVLILWVIRCFVKQINRLNAKIDTIDIALKNYKMHLKKDVQVWTGGTDQVRKEFKKFEESYIHHMSQVNERLKKLEEDLSKDCKPA